MAQIHPIGLLGLGAYLPERVMPNEEWAQYVDTSDEWITSRTGIKRRRIAAGDQTTADLAAAAARAAMDDAGCSPQDIDELIVATDTPEACWPDTAPYVQHLLGLREIPSYDLGKSGCAGFVLGLDLARARVQQHGGRVLLIGAELLSRHMDWKDRATCVLFGDGAGATVIGADPAAAEIRSAVAGTDGSQSGILGREAGGSRAPFTLQQAQRGEHLHLVMHGRAVFREATKRMSRASRDALELAGIPLEEIALVVPHQANLRIMQAVADALELPPEKLYVNVDEYGNTGSASIPIALWEARRNGRIERGDLVLLTSFGAGFHWAAAVVRF
jgi:3-oxoacyl-[acyl-carrier-protein] synthase-3